MKKKLLSFFLLYSLVFSFEITDNVKDFYTNNKFRYNINIKLITKNLTLINKKIKKIEEILKKSNFCIIDNYNIFPIFQNNEFKKYNTNLTIKCLIDKTNFNNFNYLIDKIKNIGIISLNENLSLNENEIKKFVYKRIEEKLKFFKQNLKTNCYIKNIIIFNQSNNFTRKVFLYRKTYVPSNISKKKIIQYKYTIECIK